LITRSKNKEIDAKTKYEQESALLSCLGTWENSKPRLACLQLLLRYGAHVNQKNRFGQTPIQSFISKIGDHYGTSKHMKHIQQGIVRPFLFQLSNFRLKLYK
jgi:hypothetical protein